MEDRNFNTVHETVEASRLGRVADNTQAVMTQTQETIERLHNILHEEKGIHIMLCDFFISMIGHVPVPIQDKEPSAPQKATEGRINETALLVEELAEIQAGNFRLIAALQHI